MTTVIVACGTTKQDRACMARDLYTSNYFRLALRWARSVATDDHIYIISAKYGLVPTTQILAPYNLKIRDPGAVTADDVACQARTLNLRDTSPLYVGHRFYRRVLDPVFPGMRAPFRNAGKRGYQMQALVRYRGTIPAL